MALPKCKEQKMKELDFCGSVIGIEGTHYYFAFTNETNADASFN